jgi:hypothetical protein
MRKLKVCILALFAVFALAAVTAGTASALPEQHLLSGESYPVTAETTAEGAGVASLSTALSAPITASKVNLKIECSALGSLCPYEATFTGSEIEGKKCSTGTEPEGTIKVQKNELHLVSSSLSPLNLVGDFLVAKFTIICKKGAEELKVTVEGQALGKIENVTSGTDVTEFTGNLKCTKAGNGKQEVKEFFNDEGKATKAVLTANLGLGPETGCEEVTKTVQIKSSKMINFLF